MALLHHATLVPTKAELISGWLPGQPWFDGTVEVARPVGAYRFDDPAGEVGVESHLLDVAGELVHVPVTYRAQELPEAREWLIGTMEHSVLGTRWVYDAVGDPVYRDELTRVIGEGDTQVRMMVQTPDGLVEREPTILVRGSGEAGDGRVVVVRRPGTETRTGAVLTGTWSGQDEPVVLAYLDSTRSTRADSPPGRTRTTPAAGSQVGSQSASARG